MNIELTWFGIKSMFEIAEDMANKSDDGINDVGETYLGILIALYKKLNQKEKVNLLNLYPITTKEVLKYV